MPGSLSSLLFAQLFATALLPASGWAAGDSSQQDWLEWASGLAKTGYRVSEGSVRTLDAAACRKLSAALGTCLGATAAAPLIIPEFPADGADADRHHAKTGSGNRKEGDGVTFRLRDTDAALTVMTVPPRAAYLGYQSYLFSRQSRTYAPDGDVRHAALPDPARYRILGSLGKAINNRVLDAAVGSAWNGGAVVLITTADKSLADALIADAVAHGLDASRIFIEPVGMNVNLGSTADSDDLMTLIRYAGPQDAQASKAWFKDIAAHVRTFRVAGRQGATDARFDTPAPLARQGRDEQPLADSLDELTTLLHDWLAGKEGPPVLTGEMTVSEGKDDAGAPSGLVGAECIAKGIDCQADTSDAAGYRTGFVGLMDQGQIVLVAGVNHAAMGNADLVQLTVHDMKDGIGVAGAWQVDPSSVGFDGGGLAGSAEGVLTALGLLDKVSARLRKDLPRLYIALVSHDCRVAQSYCIPLDGKSFLPLGDRVAISERAYLRSGTTAGADPDRLLSPVVIFRPAIGAR